MKLVTTATHPPSTEKADTTTQTGRRKRTQNDIGLAGRSKAERASTAAEDSASKPARPIANAQVVGPAISDAPPMPLPPGFMPKQDGIWFNPKSEGTTPFRVCGNLNIVAQTRDDAGNAWGLLLTWHDRDGRQHNWAMPMSLLSGDGGEVRSLLLDGGFFIAPTKQARQKFIELLATVEIKARARAVSKVGWTDGAFALPDRTIGDDPRQRVIYQGTDIFDHSYRSMGDLAGWMCNVACYGVGNSRLGLALSAAFVGPLLSLLGEEGGGIHLRGPSSIGKSTALLAAASVWGSPSYTRQWRATANGLEGACVQHNDTFLSLDEMGQLDPRDAGIAAYLIANGMGKARAARSGALRAAAQWKTFFFSTGEISLGDLVARDSRGAKRSAAGQEIRILDVEADAGVGLGLFEHLHDAPSAEALARKIKEGSATDYGIAGPTFIGCLIARGERIAPILKKRISDFVVEHVPPGAGGQVARAARRFALVAAAGETAVEFGILPWPAGEATSACAITFQQWLSGRGGVDAAEDRDAIAKVRGFLEMHGGSRFEPVDSDDDAPRIINRAGFWRDSDAGREYLFLAETWKTEVCSGMDARRVAKVLAERGLLLRDSAGKNSITITLPAGIGKTRCYVVTAAIFDAEPIP